MSTRQRGQNDQQAATEALMATSRLMTGVVARTLADNDTPVTVPQLRVLVMLFYNAPLTLGAIADGLGVNPSNASRACDRLVALGLISRAGQEQDRRRVSISLTAAGQQLIASLMNRRRQILDVVVSKLTSADQRRLAQGLSALLAALDDDESVRLGITPGDIPPWIR